MKEEVTTLRRYTRGGGLKANPSPRRPAFSTYITYWNAAPLTEFSMTTSATTTMTTPTAVEPGSGKKPEVRQDTLPFVKQPQDQRQEDEQDTDEEEIDLTNYTPPDILKKTPDNSSASETLITILQSSLDNVIEQVNTERLKRINEAETQRLQAEAQVTAEVQQGKGKARADGLNAIPIIRVNSEDTSTTSSQHEGSSKPGHRRSLFGIRRMLNQIIDKTEPRDGSGSEASESRETLSGEMIPQSTEDAPGHPFHRFIKKHRSPSSEGGQAPGSETIECTACFGDFRPKQAVKTPCHYYCGDCFEQLITTALEAEAQWPPKCCLNQIPYRTISKYASPLLLKRYKDKEAEYKVPVENRIYCSEPDCGKWIRKFDKANKTARCSKGHVMCVMCRQPPHKGMEVCPQDRDLQLLDEIAEESGWRRCFKCNMLVEHREACSHMTCRCGAQFCYICGTKWRTCHCDGRELQRIKDRAESRRQEREAQTPEDAWLQNALQLIEKYEREERQRQEEWAARREERRRREAAEQARREKVRLVELEVKYNQLQSDLMGVEDWQRMELLRAHTREVDECRLAAINERKIACDTLFQKRTALRLAVADKITNYELEREREYRVRVAWEKQLEEDYARELEEFWSNKYGGQEFLDVALRSYVAKNDLRRDVWRKQRDIEMAAFRYATEEELEVREEFIEASIKCAAEIAERKQKQMKREHKAELRWLELAVTERTRLLGEMEAVESENGGEMDGASSASVTDDEMELYLSS